MSYAKKRKNKYAGPDKERNSARAERHKQRAASKWAYRRRFGKAVERGTARAKRRHP